MTITLNTRKRTHSDFCKEVEKDELELLIRRTTNVIIPQGWELTEETFHKLDNEQITDGEDWVDGSVWDYEDRDGEVFGELDEYIYDLLPKVGFKLRKVDNPNYDPKKETYSFSNQKVIEEWYLPNQ